MSNQTLIAGQPVTLTLTRMGPAGDPPGYVPICYPNNGPAYGVTLEKAAGAGGWAAAGFKRIGDGSTATAVLTAPPDAVDAQGITVYVNAPDGAADYYQCSADVVAVRIAVAAPKAITGPPKTDVAVPIISPVPITQRISWTVSHDDPCTLSNLVATLGEDERCLPNIPCTVDPPGEATAHTIGFDAPYPLDDFMGGDGAVVVTGLKDGRCWRCQKVVTLAAEGETN